LPEALSDAGSAGRRDGLTLFWSVFVNIGINYNFEPPKKKRTYDGVGFCL
jgi:hypothetical protein